MLHESSDMPVMVVGLVPVIAVGIWWTSNTLAHLFIHRPFFATRTLNVLFSACLSVALGIPQRLWRERHLAHHQGGCLRSPDREKLRRAKAGPRFASVQILGEVILIGVTWATVAFTHPVFFGATYLPGYLLGLGLCWVQGHYEHAHGTTSHYGWFYNVLCFNDGYHVEHHANPGVHWTRLTERLKPDAHTSAWPALVRWLDSFS